MRKGIEKVRDVSDGRKHFLEMNCGHGIG